MYKLKINPENDYLTWIIYSHMWSIAKQSSPKLHTFRLICRLLTHMYKYNGADRRKNSHRLAIPLKSGNKIERIKRVMDDDNLILACCEMLWASKRHNVGDYRTLLSSPENNKDKIDASQGLTDRTNVVNRLIEATELLLKAVINENIWCGHHWIVKLTPNRVRTQPSVR